MKTTSLAIFATFLMIGFLSTTLVAQDQKVKIKFTKKALKVGDVVTLARTTSNDVNQSVSLPDFTQKTTQNSKSKDVKIFTVTAVGDKGVTGAKVEYKTFESTNKVAHGANVQETEDESPLVGKTFNLTLKDGQVTAKNDEGEAATTEELAAIKKELKNEITKGTLIDPCQQMDSIIGEREVAVGEVIKVDKATANKIFGAEESGNNIESISLTLKGKKTVLGVECGVFDVKVEVDTAKMEASGMKVTTKIEGEFAVGASNLWAYNVKVAGPITGNGTVPTPQGDATVEIDGKVAMSAMAVFATAKK